MVSKKLGEEEIKKMFQVKDTNNSGSKDKAKFCLP
jgi:hypothetical protein